MKLNRKILKVVEDLTVSFNNSGVTLLANVIEDFTETCKKKITKAITLGIFALIFLCWWSRYCRKSLRIITWSRRIFHYIEGFQRLHLDERCRVYSSWGCYNNHVHRRIFSPRTGFATIFALVHAKLAVNLSLNDLGGAKAAVEIGMLRKLPCTIQSQRNKRL